MTVSSSTNRVSYSGNGTLTTFAYTFKVFDEGDLTVILRASDGTETVQTITTAKNETDFQYCIGRHRRHFPDRRRYWYYEYHARQCH